MGKAKKKKNQDFQKVKLKVGKKLKKADNVTNTSFKSRSIQISQQLKTADSTQPTTKKKQNITELFGHCKHYSASVRHEAVIGLKEILSSNNDLVQKHLSTLLEKCFEMVSDKDTVVRRTVIKSLLKLVLPSISEKQIMPFFPLVCAHLCFAMTHINDGIKVDSLLVLDQLLEHFPYLVISKSNQVLLNFIEQISRQHGIGESKSRSLSTNPDSETSSMQWRVSVLGRLQKCLEAVVSCCSENNQTKELKVGSADESRNSHIYTADGLNNVQPFPSHVRRSWEEPGFTYRSGVIQDRVGNKTTFLDGRFDQFTATLVPLLMECWVEALPAENPQGGHRTSWKNKGKVGQVGNGNMMYSVVKVTQLLWECSQYFDTSENHESSHLLKYHKEIEGHFMAGFPYSIEIATPAEKKDKTKGRNRPAVPQEKVPSETLNLTICEVMTNFVNDHTISRSPIWLTKVMTYFSNVLTRESIVIGVSAKQIVKILDVFYRAGLLEGEEGATLLSMVYQRYSVARPNSTEKKTYLQFFTKLMLQDNFSSIVREDVASQFIAGLPDLLIVSAKSNPQMTSHIISVMNKVCCQCSRQLSNSLRLAEALAKILDPCKGCVFDLGQLYQRQVISMLYFVPDLNIELLKNLTGLCRCSQFHEDGVVYLVQVIQNRYLKIGELPSNALNHISFLGNLSLGCSSADLKELEIGETTERSALQPIWILNTLSSEEGESVWNRHFCITEAVCNILRQCFNTDQVLHILLGFIQKQMESFQVLPLQAVYSVCRLAEVFSSPEAVIPFVQKACLSLVNVLVTWDKSTNQNAAQRMLGTGCKLLGKIKNGIAGLLTIVVEMTSQGMADQDLQTSLKTVSLFLTGEHKNEAISPENISLIKTLHEAINAVISSSAQGSITEVTRQLFSKFSYHVSLLLQ